VIRNILIEGIDRAGKSTLAKELKNRLAWDARFLGHREGEQYTRYLHEYAALERTVIERGHISEAVYSRLFARDDPFTATTEAVLDGVIATTMLIVYADPSLEDVAGRMRERTLQATINAAEIVAGKDAFAHWFAGHDYGGRVLTYHSRDWDELRALVDTIAARVEAS
jgi:PAS domain-containing protein